MHLSEYPNDAWASRVLVRWFRSWTKFDIPINHQLVLYVLQIWPDYQLYWDIEKFDKIDVLRILPDRVWKPDIVLFNKYGCRC